MKKLVGALCVALLVAGCGGGGSSGSTGNGGGSGGGGQPFGLDSRATPSAVQIPISASASTSLRAVDAGMGRQFGTTTLTNAGDGSDRLFVAWGGGVIRIHNRNGTAPIDFLDIMDRCRPRELTVYARYLRRGGIDINPYRSTEKGIPPHLRLARQ